MPKFAKGSKEAKDYMASLRAKRGAVKGKGAFTDIFLDTATKVGTKAGEPFKNTVGVNPFTMGFDLGEKVIAPALMKRFPPKKGKGMRRPDPPPANNPILAQPHFWNGQEWIPIPQPPPIPEDQLLVGDEIIEGEGVRRRMKGRGVLPDAETRIAPSNRDLTPELTGSGMCRYECCSNCGGMGLKKKTRM